MDQVTNEIVPFMVNWQSKQDFHTPNGVQDHACMNIVASRLCEEVFYEYAKKTDPSKISEDPKDQAEQIAKCAKFVSDTALGIISHDIHPKAQPST